jgi:predicted nucleic acid-binding protein
VRREIRVLVHQHDPSDNIYLACAVEGNAGFIISGGHHLTDLKTFRGIPIVNPAAFLKQKERPSATFLQAAPHRI